MSHNIVIEAQRLIKVRQKNGKWKEDTQVIGLHVLQTPARITEEILLSSDPLKQYLAWAASFPNTLRTLKEFKAKVKSLKKEGYELYFSCT